jgi:hypothetical protein
MRVISFAHVNAWACTFDAAIVERRRWISA